MIDKLKLDAATRMQMMQEVRLMKLVQHPYVVRLYEVIDTQTKLYLGRYYTRLGWVRNVKYFKIKTGLCTFSIHKYNNFKIYRVRQ